MVYNINDSSNSESRTREDSPGRLRRPTGDHSPLTTKITTEAGGRYSGNVHCDDMLIGSVGDTADNNTLSALPAKYARTPASLIKNDNRYYVRFGDGTQIEATPLRMS